MSRKSKAELIEELVSNQRKAIKLRDEAEEKEVYTKNVEALVKNEKEDVFKVEVKLEDGVPIQKKKRKRKFFREKLILPAKFPVVRKDKIDGMFDLLESPDCHSLYKNSLIKCFSSLHTSAKPPCNSPSVILKAIRDSVLRRKWNNLTKLLLMLLPLPCNKYKPIIRHMCQILEKNHPDIQNTELQKQLRLISSARIKKGNTKLLE